MGPTRNVWVGLACGAALGLGGIVTVDAVTESADAQAEFRVTPGQLQVNQRISQAAVRRSNEALNLLRPIREAPARRANEKGLNQSGGVRPGTGTGWQPAQVDVPALRSALGSSGGETGPPGPPGPQGPAGPSGSAASSTDVPVTSTEPTDVLGLVSRGSGPLVLADRRRVLATAHFRLTNPAETAALIVCRLVARPAGGGAEVTLSTVRWIGTVGSGLVGTSGTVTGAGLVDPGSHDVVLRCNRDPSLGVADFREGQLLAWTGSE